MTAHVIRIDALAREKAADFAEERIREGFSKALALVHVLRYETSAARKSAVENWLGAGRINFHEKEALYDFYGWGRP